MVSVDRWVEEVVRRELEWEAVRRGSAGGVRREVGGAGETDLAKLHRVEEHVAVGVEELEDLPQLLRRQRAAHHVERHAELLFRQVARWGGA